MRRRVGRAAQRLGPARSLKPREPADAGGYQWRSAETAEIPSVRVRRLPDSRGP